MLYMYTCASRRKGERQLNRVDTTAAVAAANNIVPCNIVYFNLSFVTSGVEIAQKNILSSYKRD